MFILFTQTHITSIKRTPLDGKFIPYRFNLCNKLSVIPPKSFRFREDLVGKDGLPAVVKMGIIVEMS